MDILISGLQKIVIEELIEPKFCKMSFMAQYSVIPDIKEAEKFVEMNSVDLMILGGVLGDDYLERQRVFYKIPNTYIDFAKKNNKISSIFLVPDRYHKLMNDLRNDNPPDLVCYFHEFEKMKKVDFERIMKKRK